MIWDQGGPPAEAFFLRAWRGRLAAFFFFLLFFFFSFPPYVAVSSELVFRTACEYGESVDA